MDERRRESSVDHSRHLMSRLIRGTTGAGPRGGNGNGIRGRGVIDANWD